MCMTSQPSGLATSDPAHRPTVARLTGFKRRGRTKFVVRSYFVSSGFTSELVLGMPRADSAPTSKPGRSQGAGSLGQFEPVQELDRAWSAHSRRPRRPRHPGPEVAPGGRHGGHAGGAAGLHVARIVAHIHAAPGADPAGGPHRAAAPGAAWCAACCRRPPAPRPSAKRQAREQRRGQRRALLVTMPQGRPAPSMRLSAPAWRRTPGCTQQAPRSYRREELVPQPA
jgi:hypothetical protein